MNNILNFLINNKEFFASLVGSAGIFGLFKYIDSINSLNPITFTFEEDNKRSSFILLQSVNLSIKLTMISVCFSIIFLCYMFLFLKTKEYKQAIIYFCWCFFYFILCYLISYFVKDRNKKNKFLNFDNMLKSCYFNSLILICFGSVSIYLYIEKDKLLIFSIAMYIALVISIFISYFIQIRLDYSNKMNLAYIYYIEDNKERYIFRSNKELLISGNKCYTECSLKEQNEFRKKIRKITKKINKKEYNINFNDKKSLEDWIKKINIYYFTLRVNEKEIDDFFNIINNCIEGNLDNYQTRTDYLEAQNLEQKIDNINKIIKLKFIDRQEIIGKDLYLNVENINNFYN